MSKISDELNTISEFPNTGDPHWCATYPGFKEKYDMLNESDKKEVDTFARNVKTKVDNLIDKRSKSTSLANFDQLKRLSDEIINKSTKHGKEIVDDPGHYCSKVSKEKMKYIIDRIVKRGYIEVIDVIDAFDLNFNIGNSVKYELRLGRKDDSIIEIDKAIKYLEFEKEMILADRQN